LHFNVALRLRGHVPLYSSLAQEAMQLPRPLEALAGKARWACLHDASLNSDQALRGTSQELGPASEFQTVFQVAGSRGD
jgi:hypothetical protein